MNETLLAWTLHLYELLSETTQLSPWAYVLVSTGGVASGLSPCYLPVLTLFAGSVGGFAPTRGAGFSLGLAFVAGNAVTLALVGALAALGGGAVGALLTSWQLDRWIPGVIGILMGLHLLGVLHLRLPRLAPQERPHRPATNWRAFLLGVPFGLVITPCAIPIFVAIITFVAFQASVLHGALLLVAYALGRGSILVLVGLFAGSLKTLKRSRTAAILEPLSGVLLLVVSMALLLFYEDFLRFIT
jgi:cytochrome c-type biogenesis protein